ncbi:hypothetical protein RHGRI_030329 [Rhododendron griersonianum]|uniref:Uncharacterized protein n=1 Tax=Rhododendron griersonianum TaxID=479676 RepID=A0AAV6ITE4_9ERIC|nr:hypothetical protein RHGRI_030329 [Rhododendron griersonianum]
MVHGLEPNWTPIVGLWIKILLPVGSCSRLLFSRFHKPNTSHTIALLKISSGWEMQDPGHNVTPPTQTGKKASKKGLKKDVSPLFQQPENSPSDSLPDSSTSGNDYRALRRKYLLLEEESFGLGTELREVEDEVKTLEEEKIALLNELVVLEGLINPSELQSQGPRLP